MNRLGLLNYADDISLGIASVLFSGLALMVIGATHTDATPLTRGVTLVLGAISLFMIVTACRWLSVRALLSPIAGDWVYVSDPAKAHSTVRRSYARARFQVSIRGAVSYKVYLYDTLDHLLSSLGEGDPGLKGRGSAYGISVYVDGNRETAWIVYRTEHDDPSLPDRTGHLRLDLSLAAEKRLIRGHWVSEVNRKTFHHGRVWMVRPSEIQSLQKLVDAEPDAGAEGC